MVVPLLLFFIIGQKREGLNDWPTTLVIALVIENSLVGHYFSARNLLTDHQFTSHDCSPHESINEMLLTRPACLLNIGTKRKLKLKLKLGDF